MEGPVDAIVVHRGLEGDSMAIPHSGWRSSSKRFLQIAPVGRARPPSIREHQGRKAGITCSGVPSILRWMPQSEATAGPFAAPSGLQRAKGGHKKWDIVYLV